MFRQTDNHKINDNLSINIQLCQFQVGSFNYDVNKMVFMNEFVADSSVVRYVISSFQNF